MKHVLMFLLLPVLATAQPAVDWTRTYGGPGEEGFTDMLATADGGAILTGSTESYGAGWTDLWVLKVNADGDSVTSRTFGGAGYESCAMLLETEDGGYLLSGMTFSFGGEYGLAWFIKLNAALDSSWSRRYEVGLLGSCPQVIQTGDGGYAVSVGAQNAFMLMRLSAAGDSLWARTYRPGLSNNCFELAATPDGGFVLVGEAIYEETVSWDAVVMKTSAQGDSLWARSFGGMGDETLRSVLVEANGEILVAGQYVLASGEWPQGWLARLDATGELLWDEAYRTGEQQSFWNIARAHPEGYLLSGYSFSAVDAARLFVVKVNAAGEPLWESLHEIGPYGRVAEAVQAADGAVLMASTPQDAGTLDFDFMLVRLEPELRSDEPSSGLPREIRLIKSYPNPFNSETAIAYELARQAFVTVTVYDALGRTVEQLWSGTLPAGRHEARFSPVSLASGVYFCRLNAGSTSTTAKLVLIR